MVRTVSLVGAPSRFLFIYYEIKADTVYFLGLVHELRHPDFLKQQLLDGEFGGA